MPSMWTTLSQGRDGVMARGVDVVRRTRETGADLLGRAEQRTTALQERLATRRGGLNGHPIERVERRVLAGIESILGRMGIGLRIQIRRLASSTPEHGSSAPVVALDAERALPSPVAASATVAARAPRKRMRIEVRDVPVASGSEAAPAKAAPRARAKKKPAKKSRPAARSTRWVSPPAPPVEELAQLPVKSLLAKIGDLGEAERRALLAHERSTKARKSVIAALSAKLPS